MKPMGWVQGRPVRRVKAAARSAADWPVSEEAKGCVGRPPDLGGQVVPGLAQRLDGLREEEALATVSALGA
jgi:hypothetical protein